MKGLLTSVAVATAAPLAIAAAAVQTPRLTLNPTAVTLSCNAPPGQGVTSASLAGNNKPATWKLASHALGSVSDVALRNATTAGASVVAGPQGIAPGNCGKAVAVEDRPTAGRTLYAAGPSVTGQAASPSPQPSPSLRVITLSVPSARYPTIKAAVTAANADTDPTHYYLITVAPRRYSESVNTTRDITLTSSVIGTKPVINGSITTAEGHLFLDDIEVDGAIHGSWAQAQKSCSLVVHNAVVSGGQIIADDNPACYVEAMNTLLTNAPSNAIQIGNVQTAVLRNNEICGVASGDAILSKAPITVIDRNFLYSGLRDPKRPSCRVGSGSHAIEVPVGGQVAITNNHLFQGPAASDPNLVAYGTQAMAFHVNWVEFTLNQLSTKGVANSNIFFEGPAAAQAGVAIEGYYNYLLTPFATKTNQTALDKLQAYAPPPRPASPQGTISIGPNGAPVAAAANAASVIPGQGAIFSWGAADPASPPDSHILIDGLPNGEAARIVVDHNGAIKVCNPFHNYGWYSYYYGIWLNTYAPVVNGVTQTCP
jgi:hypothetical protein